MYKSKFEDLWEKAQYLRFAGIKSLSEIDSLVDTEYDERMEKKLPKTKESIEIELNIKRVKVNILLLKDILQQLGEDNMGSNERIQAIQMMLSNSIDIIVPENGWFFEKKESKIIKHIIQCEFDQFISKELSRLKALDEDSPVEFDRNTPSLNSIFQMALEQIVEKGVEKRFNEKINTWYNRINLCSTISKREYLRYYSKICSENYFRNRHLCRGLWLDLKALVESTRTQTYFKIKKFASEYPKIDLFAQDKKGEYNIDSALNILIRKKKYAFHKKHGFLYAQKMGSLSKKERTLLLSLYYQWHNVSNFFSKLHNTIEPQILNMDKHLLIENQNNTYDTSNTEQYGGYVEMYHININLLKNYVLDVYNQAPWRNYLKYISARIDSFHELIRDPARLSRNDSGIFGFSNAKLYTKTSIAGFAAATSFFFMEDKAVDELFKSTMHRYC
ncbi:hypothetical protein NEPAR06_0618 [Nematocida parisii]|uniref:uncharacterized protein n=1 Tax=Nematocida parisii (strain ERTm1 / ATCC PRA-289) TaxID=881290 RepID=UPI000264B87C|nr:uncharacterized protein NEPG_01936 [Nematocida parisii ERTm1]KAI5127204.1 hypothetical protein NEPAR08_0801 [Nematocida parisii]EIJ92981.1 hypothetical protein NEPG_01936 [Nematocida parisii ERTm1]KAI5127299.1 hypothetical protein NEPAR03_0903 [Nematocida parisii]KAI5141407.1 hypothetical protein NEPAR04_0960 [Nematocida parisii]KAI5153639.1 hypothetical protein NEPAR06_0618 [Nematocida parisii]|eukprot:XP_013059764.1 hypothetical protein NEPG_01936 [Nematocida parisii ERTm1]